MVKLFSTSDQVKAIKIETPDCHLDLTDAYSHLVVDEELSHALALNTSTHGLIRL